MGEVGKKWNIPPREMRETYKILIKKLWYEKLIWKCRHWKASAVKRQGTLRASSIHFAQGKAQ